MSLDQLLANKTTLATPSEVDRVRYPEQLFTDGYLNDPIRFAPDDRFLPRTVVDQLDVIPNRVNRDVSDFLRVNFANNDPQYLSINLYGRVWNRSEYFRVINERRRSFTQLV